MTYLRKTVQEKSIKVHNDPEEMYYYIKIVHSNKNLPAFRLHSFELAPVHLSMFMAP